MDDKWSPWVDALLDESLFGRFRLLACEFLLVDERRSMGGSFDFLIELEELGVPEARGWCSGDLKPFLTRPALVGANRQRLNWVHTSPCSSGCGQRCR